VSRNIFIETDAAAQLQHRGWRVRDSLVARPEARYPRLRIDRGPAMLEVAFWETTAADASSPELVR
jgi:hypothetical protein